MSKTGLKNNSSAPATPGAWLEKRWEPSASRNPGSQLAPLQHAACPSAPGTEQSHQSALGAPTSVNRSEPRNTEQGKKSVSSLRCGAEGAGGEEQGCWFHHGPMDPAGCKSQTSPEHRDFGDGRCAGVVSKGQEAQVARASITALFSLVVFFRGAGGERWRHPAKEPGEGGGESLAPVWGEAFSMAVFT